MMTAPSISTNSVALLREKLTLLSPRKAAAFVTSLSRKERDVLEADWPVFAHSHQQPPELGPNGAPWVTWLIVGGRGAGKTRAGAEWVRTLASRPRQRIALVGLSPSGWASRAIGLYRRLEANSPGPEAHMRCQTAAPRPSRAASPARPNRGLVPL